jgi:SAM-dependent methyltransferase
MTDVLSDQWLPYLQCPLCRQSLEWVDRIASAGLYCNTCLHTYPVVQDIPCLIEPALVDEQTRFCEQYDALRKEEGWASDQPGYYAALPYQDLTGLHAKEWAVRVRSVAWLSKWLKHTFGENRVSILDAGAGAGWLSQILAPHYEVLTMDVNIGSHGLNAFQPSQRPYQAMQGLMDRIPLAKECLDVVIANASLQYATDHHRVLQEAYRILRPQGYFVVMDSPVYPDQQSVNQAHQRTLTHYDNMGWPHIATRYTGIRDDLFSPDGAFTFQYFRRDLSTRDYLSKKVRTWLGKSTGARFPIIVGRAIK